MASNMRKLALMTAMTMMMTQANRSSCAEHLERTPKKDTSHLRKKCKSCKLFPCNSDKHKWRSNPMAQACEKYEHK